MTATVVLVHGAWHGAWCWGRVVGPLRARGIEVVAVDLPGHGDDPRPLADLHGDAAAVRDVLDTVDGPVVLVGHSYGGAVITEAGTHPAVAELVYLAAFCIDETESCAAAGTPDDTAAISHEGRPELGDGFRFQDDGSVVLDPEVGAVCLYNDCSPDDVAWALAQLGPEAFAGFTQSPAEVAWRSRPTTYVVCEHDQGVHPELQRLLATRATTTVSWATDHSPFLSAPDLVVDLLADVATAAG